MSTWRERLCGSIAGGLEDEEAKESLQQFLNPNENLSCGGGFFPNTSNEANLQTYTSNFLLPTKTYSVLIFRNDGSAVIYSDNEETNSNDDLEDREFYD